MVSRDSEYSRPPSPLKRKVRGRTLMVGMRELKSRCTWENYMDNLLCF